MRAAVLALMFVPLVVPGTAEAKTQSDVAYALKDVFSTAARFVRIDRGCAVTDKDPESAFITFECPTDDGKTRRGALELISNSKNAVRLQLTLGDEPHYMELRFLELLGRKLRDELGTPVAAPRPQPPHSDAPDAGAP